MKTLRANLILLTGSLAICCVLYPLVLWAFADTFFPSKAEGSLIARSDGTPVGSRQIAQNFTKDQYFWPRPSACDYNAAAACGSNWGASQPKLRARVEDQLKKLPAGIVPADAVTASGSGLDPHITVRNAQTQLVRVATARIATPENIRTVVNSLASAPLGGLAGEPLVNVLELNLELDRQFPMSAPK